MELLLKTGALYLNSLFKNGGVTLSYFICCIYTLFVLYSCCIDTLSWQWNTLPRSKDHFGSSYCKHCTSIVQTERMLPLIQVELSVEVYYSNGLIQWAQTKLVHMTLGNTSVLCKHPFILFI